MGPVRCIYGERGVFRTPRAAYRFDLPLAARPGGVLEAAVAIVADVGVARAVQRQRGVLAGRAIVIQDVIAGLAPAGDGELAHLGLDRAIEGDGDAVASSVERRLLGAAAHQPDVAGHSDVLDVDAGADADGVLGHIAGGVEGRQVVRRRVECVLDDVESVHLPGETVVGAGLAVIVVGVIARPPLLQVADVHPAARAWRRWVGRVARVDHGRHVERAIVVRLRADKERVEENLAGARLGRAEVGAVGPEIVVGVELRRRAEVAIDETGGAVVGKDGVAHVHRRARGRLKAGLVLHDGVVEHFQVGLFPVYPDTGFGTPDDAAGKGDRLSAILHFEAIDAAVVSVQGDAGETGAHDPFGAGERRGVSRRLDNRLVGASADDLDAADQMEWFCIDARSHQHAVRAAADGGLDAGELFATGGDDGVGPVGVITHRQHRAGSQPVDVVVWIEKSRFFVSHLFRCDISADL